MLFYVYYIDMVNRYITHQLQYEEPHQRATAATSTVDTATASTSAIIDLDSSTANGSSTNDTQEIPKAKKPRLFEEYDDVERETSSEASVAVQINKYISVEYNSTTEDCFTFWHRNKEQLGKLFRPAMTALSIPASSAPVERVFSYSGLFIRPHRARLSDKTLSALTYLRCNMAI